MEEFFSETVKNNWIFNNSWLVLMGIAIAVFVASAIVALKNKKNLTFFIGVLCAGASFANLLLVATLSKHSKSFLFDLAAIKQATDEGFISIPTLNDKPLNFLRFVHAGLVYLSSILVPTLWTIFVISIFKGVSATIRFSLFGRRRDLYIFSELNENSLRLARDIKSHEKKSYIIFCKVNDKNTELKGEVYDNKFLLLSRSEITFVKKSKHKYKRYFFALCDDDNKNFQIAHELVSEYRTIIPAKSNLKDDFSNVKIFIKNEDLLPELALNSRDLECKSITVSYINKSEMAANELLFEKPLYIAFKNDNKEAKKHLEMLIVGTTKCADKILKLAVSCSQMGEGYSTKFIIADKNASDYKEKLLFETPELFLPEYKIEFHDVATGTNSFKEFLDKKCKNVNYVAVCNNDDELNFQTAVSLRSYFIRKNPAKEEMPFIGVYLQETKRATIDILHATQLEKYELFAFGKSSDVFSYNLLINSELENLALNVHACYSYGKSLSTEERIQEFNKSETDRRSNRATAVHLKYKTYILGYEFKLLATASEKEKSEADKIANEFLQKISNPEIAEEMAKIEHSRWAAHTRSDGWISVSKENSKLHIEKTITSDNEDGTHKFNLAKMHPCLCSWEELDILGKYLDNDFKSYDRQICDFLPGILGLINNDDINISGVKYILTKI